MDIKRANQQVFEASKPFQGLRRAMGEVIFGQQAVIDRLLIALLTDGHVLLEGMPGLAKTLAVTALASFIQCDCKRVQFTPDLLPADLIGTQVWDPNHSKFTVHRGPIFTQILLADEINRAPGKVQSALLEVMQERQVTILGETFAITKPYLVVATQNPIEQEGTYPLPEAQVDRFIMKVCIDYPTLEEEKRIVEQYARIGPQERRSALLSPEEIFSGQSALNEVFIDPKVVDYILTLTRATRPGSLPPDLEGLIEFGASPRAALGLVRCAKAYAFLHGRSYTTPEDVQEVVPDVLRHRVSPSFEAEAQNVSVDALLQRVVDFHR